jgi:TfoX/Sxy family transcriptional regulator of competence genes
MSIFSEALSGLSQQEKEEEVPQPLTGSFFSRALAAPEQQEEISEQGVSFLGRGRVESPETVTEPSKPEKQEPKGLLKVLDILQRPNFAIAGAAKAAKEGKPILASAAKGFFGEERNTFTDVLESVGWEPTTTKGKIAKGVTGFALDVLTDPLTYVSFGTLTGIGKAASKTSKLAPTATKQAQAGQRALIQFMGKEVVKGEKVFEKTGQMLEYARGTGVGDFLGRTFKSNFRPASVDPEVWQQVVKLKTAAKNVETFKESKAMDLALKTQIMVNKAVKEHGDEALTKTLTAIEKPKLIQELPSDLQEIAKISRDYLDELAEVRNWAKKGIIGSDDFKYLPHVHKQDFLSDMKSMFGKAKIYKTEIPSDKTREVFKFVDDSEEVLGIAKADDLKLKKVGDEFFDESGKKYNAILPTVEEKIVEGYKMEDNISALLGIAGKRTAQLEKSKIFLDEIKGLSVNRSGLDNFTKESDALFVKAPELKGFKFNPEIAREIDQVYEKVINPEEINRYVKLYDTVQNSWKGLATYVNPAFHSRNAVSNMYNNALAGVKSPKSYGKATIIQAALEGEELSPAFSKLIGKTLGDKASKTANETIQKLNIKYYDDFLKQGLGGGTFFGSDIERTISQRLKPTLFGTTKLGGIKKVGQKTGQAVEQNARLAHFIDKVDKGFTPEAAATSVKKHLFDYEELTKAEKEIFKRVVPFYTWTRKNLPLQLENVITKPRIAVGLGKGITGVEKAADTDRVDKKLLPEWLQKATPVIIGEDKGVLKTFKLEGYLPIGDLARLDIQDAKNQLSNMTSPLIKVFPELAWNYNSFYQKKIQEFEGEGSKLLRLENHLKVNPYINHLVRQIRPISELDKLIGKPHDDVSVKAKTINLLLGGKIYHIDKAKQRAWNRRLLKDRRSTLKSKIKYRLRIGDDREANRLKKILRETI